MLLVLLLVLPLLLLPLLLLPLLLLLLLERLVELALEFLLLCSFSLQPSFERGFLLALDLLLRAELPGRLGLVPAAQGVGPRGRRGAEALPAVVGRRGGARGPARGVAR